MCSHSVLSDSLRPYGLWPARFLCLWNFPGKNTGVGCHLLLHETSLTRDQTHVSRLPHWQASSLALVPPGKFFGVAQTVKCLPTMRETWVQSLGREELPETEMAAHSSILARKIPWTGEPGRLQSMGSKRVGHD